MPLYAFGSNGSGQLGIESTQDASKPTLCYFADPSKPSGTSPSLRGTPLKIVAGGNTTFILLDTGTVFAAGASFLRQKASDENDRKLSLYFEPLNFPNPVKTTLCSSAWDASFFVDSEDRIFAVGAGAKGELGLGPEISFCKEATRVKPFLDEGDCVVDIASSVSHTVLVTARGQVFGWGNGRKGQLGAPAEIVWSPRKISGIEFHVTRVVCGREFSCLISDSKDGQYCIIGSDKWSVRSQGPPNLRGWKEIGASWGSIFILDCDGSIQSWGRNDRGQLAPPQLPHIQQMAVGSEHVVAFSDGTEILCWGWGEHGNCGEETDDGGNVNGRFNRLAFHSPSPTKVILDLGAGCATTFFWMPDG